MASTNVHIFPKICNSSSTASHAVTLPYLVSGYWNVQNIFRTTASTLPSSGTATKGASVSHLNLLSNSAPHGKQPLCAETTPINPICDGVQCVYCEVRVLKILPRSTSSLRRPFFCQYFGFSPVGIIPLLLHTLLDLNSAVVRRTSGSRSGILKSKVLRRELSD